MLRNRTVPALGLALGLAMAGAQAQQAAAPAHVRIGFWDAQTDPLARIAEPVLRRAYAEARQPVEFVDLPMRRAMALMLTGGIDGNAYRIAELAQEQPGVFRVDPAILVSEIRVYAPPSQRRIGQWADLIGLRVAYQRGVLVIERHLPKNAIAVEAASEADVFRLVANGLADVGLSSEPSSAKPQARAKARNLVRQEAVLTQTPLHHYVLASQKELGQRLSEALKKLEANGELPAIRTRALAAME